MNSTITEHKNDNETKSCKSKEELLIEYNNICCKKDLVEYYLRICNQIETAISDDDISFITILDHVVEYIINIKDETVLQDMHFCHITENRIRGTNIIILSCKYNKQNVLNYFFSNESKLLNSLSIITKNSPLPTDVDEIGHNAFYYAMLSNGSELLDVLVNKWPGNYFKTHDRELNEILSSSYAEFRLKNIFLSPKIELLVLEKLINFNFFSNDQVRKESNLSEREAVNLRIKFLDENIALLPGEYSNVVDEKLLLIMRNVAINIFALRQSKLLRSTEDASLPWHEIEFCVICFINAFTKENEMSFFCKAVLNVKEICGYLKMFVRNLKEIIKELNFNSTAKRKYRNKKREEIINNILGKYPEFQDLYRVYDQLRDIHSLDRISTYTDLALSADPEEKEEQWIIIRSLQVIGECLKNTAQSPKLSQVASNLLMLSLSENARKTITNLRDSLSHEHSLLERSKIEKQSDKRFYTGIQTEIKQIAVLITDILHDYKSEILRTVLQRVINCENIDEMKEIAEMFETIEFQNDFVKRFETNGQETLEKLLEKLNNEITEKTMREQDLFDEAFSIVYSHKNKSKKLKEKYFDGFNLFLGITKSYFKELDHNAFRGIKFKANLALENMVPTMTTSELDEISELTLEILDSVLDKMVTKKYELLKTVYKILHIIKCGTNDVRSFKKLERKLKEGGSKVEKAVKKSSKAYETDFNHLLSQKLADLKRVLSNNALDENLDVTLPSYIRNAKLQAVIEMLILDIMAIYSDNYLEHNSYFLDERFPVLVGRALRNHLAHHNIIVELMSESSMAIVLNARKLAEEAVIVEKKKIGRSIPDDPASINAKHKQDLTVLDTQVKMFNALERGDEATFGSCLKNGADIHGRAINSSTVLHFAAKGFNLEGIKSLINKNINVHAVDSKGRNILHIASFFGRDSIVKFLIEKLGLDVDCVDRLGKTALHVAAENGHLHVVQTLLKHKANFATKDKSGLLPIFHAVRNNHVDVATSLLEKFPGINRIESMGGFSPLHEAAERGNIELVELFLRKLADVNATTDRDWTPLHEAALNGHSNIVKVLVREGADINAKALSGCTALHFATENGHEEIVDILLKHGANINAVDKVYRNTPLHYVVMDGREKLVNILIQNGAWVDVSTYEGMTPLHFAAHRGYVEIVKILLSRDINIDAKNVNNCTPLHLATWENHKEIVKCLLAYNAVIDSKDEKGFTSLHVAASNGWIDICRILIEKKADVCIASIDGSTPLHLAAAKGSTEIIDLLLKCKAKINSKNNDGLTPLYFAALNGNIDAVHSLIKYESSFDVKILYAAIFRNHVPVVELLMKKTTSREILKQALCLAIKCGCKNILEILIEKGAEIKVEEDHTNPLILAVKENRKEIIEVLLEKGADVNANEGRALFIAVFQGSEDILNLLLKYNPNINQKGDYASALHIAAKMGHIKIVDTLLTKGADVQSRCDDNRTPIFLAAQEGHDDIVELLISKGAEVNVKSNDENSTPLHAAAAMGHDNVVKILLEKQANAYCIDNKSRTAFELAVARGHLDVLKTFMQHVNIDINFKGPDDFALLHIASQESRLDIVKFLIEKGADMRIQNSFGSGPIHIAAREGHVDIVKLFLRKGLSVNEITVKCQAPMHYAAMYGKLQMIRFLLSEGAEACATDMFGVTPLHFAAASDSKDTVQLLIESGAVYDSTDIFDRKPEECIVNMDVANIFELVKKLVQATKDNSSTDVEKYIKSGAIVNARSEKNGTPLHYAAWKGYDTIVNILLQNGAIPDSLGKDGYTPLHYAAKFSFLKIVQSLLSCGAKYNIVSKTEKTALDFAVDKEIVKLFEILNKSFEDVKDNNFKVISTLKNIKDISTIKAIMQARNSKNETLITFAIHNNFDQVQELKNVGQDDASRELNLALALSSQGDYKNALNILQILYEERNEILGSHSPGTFDIQMHIVEVLYVQGAYPKALCALTELLEKQMKVLRLTDREILKTKNLIALVLHRQGHHKKALRIFQEIYNIQREILVPNHSDILDTQSGMALTLNALDRPEEALAMNRRVYENKVAAAGPLDPKSVRALNNIALSLMKLGNHDEALKTYEEVLKKKRITFGHNSPDTLKTLHSIASVLFLQGKEHEALNIYHEILNIQKIVLGPNHPDTLRTECNIANVFLIQGKCLKALEAYKRNFNQIKNVLGEKSPYVLDISKKMQLINQRFQMESNESEILQNFQKDINIAANNGDEETVQFLLSKGTDINVRDVDGRTPLHFAVNGEHINTVRMLLKNGANVTETTSKNNTALHIAASKRSREIVDILLKNMGSSESVPFLNVQTLNGGMTALHVAAKNGCLEIVKSLLEHGASYSYKNADGKTPLDLSESEDVLKFLKLLDDLFEDAKKGNFEIVNKLKKLPTNEFATLKNARNDLDMTLLQVTIINKHKTIAKKLLEVLQKGK